LQEEKQLQKEPKLISPDITDLTKGVYGKIELVNKEGIFGWVVDLESSELPILELHIDYQKVAETSPSIMREDIANLFKKEIISGFEFRWSEIEIPKGLRNQKIKVKVIHQRTGLPLAPGEIEFDLSFMKESEKIQEPEYIGNLDLVKGFYVYGWAYNKKNPEERVEVVVFVDDKPVAEGVADLFRQDLLDAGIGDGKHAFAIKLPEDLVSNEEQVLSVKFKKMAKDLGHSPQKVKFQKYKGEVKGLNQNAVEGYCLDLNNLDKPIHLFLIENKKILASAWTNPSENGKFILYLPEELLDGRPHIFEIQTEDGFLIGYAMGITPYFLTSSNFKEASAQKIHPNLKRGAKEGIYGHIDKIDETGIYGWFVDLSSEETPELTILINSVPVGKISQFHYRADVAMILERYYLSGFKVSWYELDIPEKLFDEKVWNVEVFYEKVNKPLVGVRQIGSDIIKEIKKNIHKEISFYNDLSIKLEEDEIIELYIKNFKIIKEINFKKGIFVNNNILNEFFNYQKFIPLRVFENDFLNSLVFFRLGLINELKKDFSKAKNYYELAIILNKELNIALEHIANIEYNLRNIFKAKYLYNELLNGNYEGVTCYVAINLASILESQKLYDDAINILLKEFEKNQYSAHKIRLIKDKIEHTLKLYFEDMLKEIEALASMYLQVKENLKLVEKLSYYWEKLNRIYKLIQKIYYIQEGRKIRGEFNYKKVLIIAGSMDLPQCRRYRIEQKIEQLKEVNIDSEVIPFTEISKHFEKIYEYDLFIFYRLPITFDVLKFISIVNGLGKISIFEIDDLIFDPVNYPPHIESFGGYVDIELYRGLIYGMFLFNLMARFCKYGLASTKPLANHLSNLVQTGKAFVHRNALDSKNFLVTSKIKNKSELIIFYGSGTLSHNQDFIDLALPALDKILDEYNSVKLMIVGYLQLPEWFLRKHSKQLKIIPYISNIKDYFELLMSADINLAVLYDGVFEGCKSELKWIEAACFGIPSVVSTTENYRDVIRHGVDGFIANDPDDFYKYIKVLIENPELRYKVGENAQKRILKEYSIENMGKNLKTIILSILEDFKSQENIKINLKVDKDRRKKIAIVNVFFPPQLIGGGTVIAYENARILNEKYSDKYEVVIFTSDAFHNPSEKPYTLKEYYFEGMRVYQVIPNFLDETGNYKKTFEWGYYDPKIKEIFKEFLDKEKPDLVHFHAIQRLTASIVEACLEYNIPYMVAVHDAWWISDWIFLTDDKGNVYPEGFDIFDRKRSLPEGVSIWDSIERRLYLKDCLEKANFVYTVSQEFANIYKKNNIENIQVIENGISPFINWEPKKTHYTKNVVLGFSPAFAIHKGYDIFNEAIIKAKTKNIEIVLVNPYNPLENNLDIGMIGNAITRIYGQFNRNNVANFYKQIDILVHPSKWPESYGLSIREAMACGCGIIASNRVGGLKDLIDKENVFIIEPTVDEMIKVIKEIDENPVKYKKVVNHGKLRTIEEQVEELVSVYNNIIKGGC